MTMAEYTIRCVVQALALCCSFSAKVLDVTTNCSMIIAIYVPRLLCWPVTRVTCVEGRRSGRILREQNSWICGIIVDTESAEDPTTPPPVVNFQGLGLHSPPINPCRTQHFSPDSTSFSLKHIAHSHLATMGGMWSHQAIKGWI